MNRTIWGINDGGDLLLFEKERQQLCEGGFAVDMQRRPDELPPVGCFRRGQILHEQLTHADIAGYTSRGAIRADGIAAVQFATRRFAA